MGRELQRADEFAKELEATYGDDLVAVVLYGSVARGEHREGADLNVLVLLNNAGPQSLRRGTAAARQWASEGNPPPLIMSQQEWRRSADVFAIEYADIAEAHVVLFGGDPFHGVDVRPDDLRHQCERELKGKHIQLRERYLLLADQPEELGRVFVRSLSTFLVLFRTVLRLAGQTVPRDPAEVVRRTAEQSGFDPAPVLELLSARAAGGTSLAPDAAVAVGYLEAVEDVVHYVDRLMDGAE